MVAIPLNPYIVGNPIKSREMFFGREDDFQFVQKKIGEGRSNQIVVLCGERRSGKTSILFQILGGRLGPVFLPVLIDMQMLAGVSGDREFFRAIVRAACSSPELTGLTVDELAFPADGGPAEFVGAFLAAVERRAPGRITLFLLDEYELIEAKIRDGTLGESAIHCFAGILESLHRVSFVFTGSTNLEDRKVEVWRSLLGKSIYRKISYLSHRDTVRLITEPLAGVVTWPPDAAEAVYRLTGGQPFYTQVICQNMVDQLIEEHRSDPSIGDLDLIVREIVDNPLPQMIYSWNALAEGQHVVLASLAGRLEGPEERARASDVVSFLAANRIALPFAREKVNVLLEEAFHTEFLQKSDDGSYRFRMDLFRRWIRREHSIWKVAREAGLSFVRRRSALPAALSALAGFLALVAAAWFLPIPPALPAFRTRVLAAIGLAPATTPARFQQITFKANRGPFRLKIDGEQTLTSEGQEDPSTIVVPSLAAGWHRIVATPAKGVEVDAEVDVTQNDQIIDITFAAAAATAGPATATSAPANAAAGSAPGTATPAEASATVTAGGEEGAATPAAEPVSMEPTTTPQAAEIPAAQPASGETAAANEEQKFGILVVSTKPPEASVAIDGRATGRKTPFTEKLVPGNYTVTLTLIGYRSATFSLYLGTGKPEEREIVLEKAWAEVTFDVRPTAKIYLDGQFLVETPIAKSFRVQAGPHVLAIINEELKVRKELPIDLAEGQKLHIQEKLE